MASRAMEAGPVELNGGDLAGIITASFVGVLGIGRGLKWYLASRTTREQWIEDKIRVHFADIESRLAATERRADRLEHEKYRLEAVSQMLAFELERLDPTSTILKRAQAMLATVAPTPTIEPFDNIIAAGE